MSFRLRPEAESDLEALFDYMTSVNPSAADRAINAVYASCGLLGEMPRGGRARPDLGPGLRSYPVGNIMLIYRVTDHGVEIVYVADGRRDLAALVTRDRR